MTNKCPLCGQVLPAALDEQSLHEKLDNMQFAAIQEATKAAQKKLESDFENRLTVGRRIARQQAEERFNADLRELKKKLDEAERSTARQIAEARKEAAAEAQRLLKGQLDDLNRKVQMAERKTATEVAKAKSQAAQTAKETERLKHARELIRLRREVEVLNRQLEQKSGEQFGEMAELDLTAELTRAFPTDRIERVGRGVKGADILHTVMDGDKAAGRIVYESKNVSAWQNAFIEQAKKYHAQYETPYVLVVSRVFPKKQRGACVVDDVPVVEPRLATTLAAVMRDGILEIAKLRLTKVGTNEKAQELFRYVISGEFQTRFRAMADAVDGLKNIQQSERTWHENQWARESCLYAQIESRHREINAKLLLTVKEGVARKPLAVVSVVDSLHSNIDRGLGQKN
jgi:hypothetical protein